MTSNLSSITRNTASQQYEAAFITADGRQRAVNFILEFGTNLQRERLLYHFPTYDRITTTSNPVKSPAANDNVIAAIQHYQNDDGGFGHGIEADLRSKRSSVIATTVGLQILDSVDGLDSAPARAAIDYLIANYIDGRWLPITADCNDAPHAPWWNYDSLDTRPGFLPNPGVEVLAYLLQCRAMSSETSQLLEQAIAYSDQNALDMHELLCYSRLYRSIAATDELKQQLLPGLLCHAFRLVNVEAKDWEEYCLTPLTIIEHPESVFASFFKDSLECNIRYLIQRQNDDGSWSPNWSWAGEFPATWKLVKTEIKAELTLKNLLQLRQFERF